MCGISGYLGEYFEHDQLRQSAHTMRHRGPDAEGFYSDGPVGLAHRRLSIIDLSTAANQPMTSANGRYVMVFNGEVYNHSEVARDLSLQLKTRSDSEVVLEAYAKNGPEVLHHFNGMFAIAIWDKEKKSLFLARDRFGIKPLCYYKEGRNLAFASELKGLLPFVKQKEADHEAIGDFLFLEYIPPPATILKNCFKLPAGHYMIADRSGIKIRCWYNLLEKVGEPHAADETEMEETLHALLRSSVKARLASDVPVGAFLSGGTDSSLISAAFGAVSDQTIRTFNIGFDVAQFDESEAARKVADHLQTHHTFLRLGASNSINWATKVGDYYDEPFAVSSCIPSLQVSKMAAEHVTVALSGDGGDELFMGYDLYRWYNRVSKVDRLGKPGRKGIALLLSKGDHRKQRAARILNYPSKSKQWLHVWSQVQDMFSESEIAKLGLSTYSQERLLNEWKAVAATGRTGHDQLSLFDLRNYLANDLLHKVDIASMAHGLEVRVPFLDHRLVEYAINIPACYKIHASGEQKYLLKKVLERYLPKPLIYRPKWGFPAPVGDWLQADLSWMIDRYLLKNNSPLFDHFQSTYIRRLVTDFRKGNTYLTKKVWALIQLGMWEENYLL